MTTTLKVDHMAIELTIRDDGNLSIADALVRAQSLRIPPSELQSTADEQMRLVWALGKPLADADRDRCSQAFHKIFPGAEVKTESSEGACNPAGISLDDILDAAGEWVYQTDPAHASREVAAFQRSKPKVARKTRIRYVNFKDIANACPALQSLMNGEDLPHEVTFGLATNLIGCHGGEKILRGGLQLRHDPGTGWNYWIKQIRTCGHQPEPCESFCPYAGTCDHFDIPIQHGRRRRGEVRRIKGFKKSAQFDLTHGEQCLHEDIRCARAARDLDIHLLLYGTGMGKTNAYLLFQNAIIAVPTHKLAKGVLARMHAAGNVSAYLIPEIPIFESEFNDEYKRLLDAGLTLAAWKLVRKRGREIECKQPMEDLTADEQQLLDHISAVERFRHGGGTAVITHDRLLLLKCIPEGFDTIVIDEDILRKTIRQGKTSLQDLALVINSAKAGSELQSFLQHVSADSKRGVILGMHRLTTTDKNEILEAVKKCYKNLTGDVPGFLQCDFFALMQDGTIYFCSQPWIPNDRKLIILSATADAEMYKLVFRNRGIHVYTSPEIQHVGRIIQVVGNNSRSTFTGHGGEEQLAYIEAIVRDTQVLTFRRVATASGLNIIEGAHFGNIEGLNDFSGQDLAVVGTPHLNPIAYSLYAAAYGMDRTCGGIASRNVQRNGYEFKLMTYPSGSDLQKLQLWLLESELIQAIGRARTLREPCTVLVFAAIPLACATSIFEDGTDPDIVRKAAQCGMPSGSSMSPQTGEALAVA